MTPLNYYLDQCEKDFVVKDDQQLKALGILETIYQHLLKEFSARNKWYNFLRKPQVVKGLYLWGGVGIGKTYVMDCFYHCLPFKQKLRIHFHQFMQWVHLQLKEYQGQPNPLEKIAKALSKKTMILCFDELHVSDIADAMILARLFKALKEYGVSIVTTSNVMPDDLYKKGLQRPLFIPAIELLKEVTTVMHIENNVDYRLQHLSHAGAFYTPLDEIAEENMEKSFMLLNDQQPIQYEPVNILDRKISVVKVSANMIWFDFNVICNVPRSKNDYLEIAKKYKTVFVSNIPSIKADDKNTIRSFIHMIDVFYDAKIRLVCSSANEIGEIYTSGDMIFEFARTRSRLTEMQSEHYFYHQ